MEASASGLVDSKHGTSNDEEDVAKQLFSFKSLHVLDSATSDEISTPDTSLKQKGTDEFQVPSIVYQEKNPTTSKKLSNKFDEKDSSFQGNWTLYCTTEPNDRGISQANEICTSIQEMHDTRPEVFTIPPLIYKKDNGTMIVCCYTPDYRDKVHVLYVAREIREIINYPYVMYYHKRVGKFTSFYMHTPDDEFYVNIEGCWTLEEL